MDLKYYIKINGRMVSKYNFSERKKCPDCGLIITNQSIRCKPCATLNMKGKHFSPRTEIKKGQHISPKTEFTPENTSGKNNPFYGKHHSEETKELQKEMKKGQHNSPKTEFKKGEMKGEKNPAWKGGISFEPYGIEFNVELKEQIRRRDNFTCQECHMTEKQLGRKLDVHHIDFIKQNNELDNLICLCKSCHSQTNYDREDWIDYFKQKVISL